MPRVVPVQHVLKVESWRFNYMFGTGKTRFCPELYSDFRHLLIRVSIVQPKGIKAKQGEVTCLGYDYLMAGYKERAKESDRTRPVGHVSYRGADYSATLLLPSDALPLILQMLIAGRYRFIEFDAEKGSRDAAIDRYSFRDHMENEPDLAAGWEDV